MRSAWRKQGAHGGQESACSIPVLQREAGHRTHACLLPRGYPAQAAFLSPDAEEAAGIKATLQPFHQADS